MNAGDTPATIPLVKLSVKLILQIHLFNTIFFATLFFSRTAF